MLTLALAAGCAARTSLPPGAWEGRVERLEGAIAALARGAEPSESRMIAETALRESQALATEYRLTRPPIFHNALVNLRIRERGLCWHWTEDLLARLRALPLSHYEFHWAIARRGQLFREHNTVVVTARGDDLASGLVLDPWRGSGELYWVRVADDSYAWQPY